MTKPLPVRNYFFTHGLLTALLFMLYTGISAQAPANDLCSGAVTLTSGAGCATGRTLLNATASPSLTGCGNASSADVWFKYTATSSYPVIALSTLGASLNAATPYIQLYSAGTCVANVFSGTSIACVSGTSLNVATAVGGAGLTVGSTYWIRIYSGSAGPFTAGTWAFNICITDAAAANPTTDFGKSYVNVTKGISGGTIEPGDVLEIRATFVVRSNTAYNCIFKDVVPANTTYVPASMKILTNEGKTYQTFSDAADGDGGTIAGSNVTINFGSGSTGSAGGLVKNTSKPSFYINTCIMVVSYRVTVNAAATYGTKVPVGLGTFTYGNSVGTPSLITFPKDTIMVYKNYGICANTVGTNAITSESGGTFGSGGTKDRVASAKVPSNYTYTAFSNSANMPNDYYYGVSNNTSGGTTVATGYSILNTYAYPTNPQRIFGVWDIIGDHTGAASPSLGNPATDDNAGAKGGYMVVINASYKTDTAFLDTISNLCPNTYYQYTAWFRNICRKCGCDSNGHGASQVTVPAYIPTAASDSSGVYPNLTFNINGFDYYTTGDIQYSGTWVQKGFTYLTGPTQTSMVINIRNNAPGGGGNDWAIDDIGVATCSPNISLTPNKPDTLCRGADDTVRFRVSAFFNNYTEWKLEKSTDNGVTWVSTGLDTLGQAASGSATPVYNSITTQYEYLVTRYYRLNMVDTLIKYRLTIASTTANLADPNCAFITSSPKIIKTVDCMLVLPTQVYNFSGRLSGGYAGLEWNSTNELAETRYAVERSSDGVKFEQVGLVNGSSQHSAVSTYFFQDNKPVAGSAWYRIRIVSGEYFKFSNIINLRNGDVEMSIRSLVNPFTNSLSFGLVSPEQTSATLSVLDLFGTVLKETRIPVSIGLNTINWPAPGNLPRGNYTLRIQFKDKIINRLVIKM